MIMAVGDPLADMLCWLGHGSLCISHIYTYICISRPQLCLKPFYEERTMHFLVGNATPHSKFQSKCPNELLALVQLKSSRVMVNSAF